MILVWLACRHSRHVRTPVSQAWCALCRCMVAVEFDKGWCLSCRTCQWAKAFGMNPLGCKALATSHALRKHHVVDYFKWGERNATLQTIGQDNQLSFDDIPPF